MFLILFNDIKIKLVVEGCLCDDNYRFFDIKNMNFFGVWFCIFVIIFCSYDFVKGLYIYFCWILFYDVGYDIGMIFCGGK